MPDRKAVKRLIRDCRKCAADRLTPGNATTLLENAADTMEAFLVQPSVSRTPKEGGE